ncbi:hypothetical protein GUJ93_ZPchr0013g34344 [Zizania palustris]|uniref:Uncharacterized protein n=1 Tax=Zizania palustris TaxID=103762 RepID=A0A8J6C0T8_ZIZPA|nr:hypothetical protein GUJ93_ZPchr0013g34344 [Zizania palustris]
MVSLIQYGVRLKGLSIPRMPNISMRMLDGGGMECLEKVEAHRWICSPVARSVPPPLDPRLSHRICVAAVSGPCTTRLFCMEVVL